MTRDERLEQFEKDLTKLLNDNLDDGVTPDDLCEIAEHVLGSDTWVL